MHKYNFIWPTKSLLDIQVADRKFTVASGWKSHVHSGDTVPGALVASRSINVKSLCSEGSDAKFLRARLYIAGFSVRPLPDSEGKPQCEVRMVSHVDFKGSIPDPIINFFQTSVIPEILECVRNLAPNEKAGQ